MNDAQKLKAFRKSRKLSQDELAEILTVKQGLISMIEKGDRSFTDSLKYSFLKAFGIDWDTQIASAETFKFEHLEDKKDKITDNIIPIPIHDISAAAGAGTWLDDEPPSDVMYFDKRFLKQILKRDTYDTIHIIHAEGDSMDSGWNQPDDIKDGDLLMVDTSQTTGNNQIFVILVDNQKLRVKKLSKQGDTLYVTSNNPAYKEEVYRPDSSESEIRVIGKVVWNGNKESA